MTHRLLPWPGRQVVEPCARDMGPVVCLLLRLGRTSHIDGRPGPALELSLDLQLLHQGLQGMLRRCQTVSNMASCQSYPLLHALLNQQMLMHQGGYGWPPWRGEQDYRWNAVRERTPMLHSKFMWALFVVGFVCM